MVRSCLSLRVAGQGDDGPRVKIARPATHAELLRRASIEILGGAMVAKMTDSDGDEIRARDYATIVEDGDILYFTAAESVDVDVDAEEAAAPHPALAVFSEPGSRLDQSEADL